MSENGFMRLRAISGSCLPQRRTSSQRRAAGDGGQEQQRRLGSDRRVQPVAETDVLPVHEDVDEGRGLVAREDAPFQRGVLRDELAQGLTYRPAVYRYVTKASDVGSENRRDAYDGHS